MLPLGRNYKFLANKNISFNQQASSQAYLNNNEHNNEAENNCFLKLMMEDDDNDDDKEEYSFKMNIEEKKEANNEERFFYNKNLSFVENKKNLTNLKRRHQQKQPSKKSPNTSMSKLKTDIDFFEAKKNNENHQYASDLPNFTCILRKPIDMGVTKRYKRQGATKIEDLEMKRVFKCTYPGKWTRVGAI